MIDDMSNDDRRRFQALAVRLSQEAGATALSTVHGVVSSRKADRTVVTPTDRAIERHILREIHEAYPEHAVIGEESTDGEFRPAADESRFCWVVDPLDGTRNFVSGLPCFATSIAVLEHGRPIAAVVREHNTGSVFSAVVGEGAFCNGRPLHVDDPPSQADHLLGIASTKDDLTVRVTRSWIGTRGYICRNLGATTVHLACVASGAMVGAFAVRAKLWDIAAGLLLVEEAGGRMTDPYGGALLPFRLGAECRADLPFLAAGPIMHARLLDSIRIAGE